MTSAPTTPATDTADNTDTADTAALPGDRAGTYRVTDPLDTDYYGVFADIGGVERDAWSRARVLISEYGDRSAAQWDAGEYDVSIVRRMGELDLFVDGIEHEGLTALSPLAAGLVNMEISRGDGSLGTVLAVQGGLALRTLALFGSDAQKAQYLQPIARGEVLGSFALTEPDHGSDSVSLETRATRTADGAWVIDGAKKWIGNGASGGVTFVWARVESPGADDHGKVRCFLVPQEVEGYHGVPITGKASLRGIHQAHITLRGVRLPADAVLPGSRSFKDASTVLYATRSGVAWSALGHATACYEAALQYSQQREQFGKRLAGFQMVQERLTQMLSELTAMQLYCRHLADLEASGGLRPTQASLAKYHNTRTARRIAATARDLLGGNGILLEYGVMQHMADIEAIHTYEGTESIQALLLGRDITGVSAFA
ncbi:acyl-CoA dehydrogenase family protein [Microbacterium kunmingense]|uniref:acyl-CoA dehydrogenase family protein n=1 Tax=Microbacterium kunmingense TaxID=2915939 RepID=UPI003D724689